MPASVNGTHYCHEESDDFPIAEFVRVRGKGTFIHVIPETNESNKATSGHTDDGYPATFTADRIDGTWILRGAGMVSIKVPPIHRTYRARRNPLAKRR